MNVIKRSTIVVYSPRQMFELVNNIEDYPRFLPWCASSTILHRDEKKVEATLAIVWSGIHKSFTTRNHLQSDKQIEITLVEGPFRHFEGRWKFFSQGEQGCVVDLELKFDLAGRLIDKLFQPIFNHIANSLVDLFCKRAAEIYGIETKNNG